MQKKWLVGLSISRCIQDIILGKINPEKVLKILGNTQARTPEQWDFVISQYGQTWWRNNPGKAEKILRQFLAEGRIEQPKLEHNRIPHFPKMNQVNWVDSEKQIIWRRPFAV